MNKKNNISKILIVFLSFAILLISCSPTSNDSQAISVSYPEKGQKFLAEDTISVKWNISLSNPKIYYNYNKGTSGWQEFLSVNYVSQTEAKVVLPTTWYSDSFQIKIEDAAKKHPEGISEYFSVKYIIITNPSSGNSYNVGETVNIQFKAYSSKLSSLRFILSTDGGKSYNDMLTGSISPTQNSLSWTIGDEPGYVFDYPSTKCILKIQDYDDGKIFDISGIFEVK
jgi:hypothetical protein